MVQKTHAKERKKESVHHKINSPVSIFILVGFFPRAHDFHPFLNFRSKHCNFDLLVTPYESALNRNYNDMNCLCVSLRWFFFLLGLINQLFLWLLSLVSVSLPAVDACSFYASLLFEHTQTATWNLISDYFTRACLFNNPLAASKRKSFAIHKIDDLSIFSINLSSLDYFLHCWQ